LLFCCHKYLQQVVLRLGTTLLNQVGKIIDTLGGTLHQWEFLLQGAWVFLDQSIKLIGPFEEQLAILTGHPEQIGNHRCWHLESKIMQDLHVPRSHCCVKESVRQVIDMCPHSLNGSRGKCFRNKGTHSGVSWRILQEQHP